MILRLFVLFVVAAGVALVLWVRLAPLDPGIWHADPGEGMRTGQPNDYLVGPDGDMPPLMLDRDAEEVMATLDAIAMAEPRTARLAGDLSEGWVTYVQRSRLMGYPDVISVRVRPEPGGRAALLIWSRSRFGISDLGVNGTRVSRWVAALEQANG